MIIDAHVHLWETLNGRVDGSSVHHVGGGRSMFGADIVQMMPPYLTDGKNSVEAFAANMDYAQVNAAVVTQEYIDGNQDNYLSKAKQLYPDRIKICSLYEEENNDIHESFDGIKICAGRLSKKRLEDTLSVFKAAEAAGKFVSVDLAEGDMQTGAMKEIISECPKVKIAIGHFGMVTRARWQEQIKLAQNPNVYIESGGITWLFHGEFYPYPSAIRAILEAKEICGMEKLMWGSDYPRTMTAITYKMSLDFVRQSKNLSDADKALFLGANAEAFYGFNQAKDLPYIRNMVED